MNNLLIVQSVIAVLAIIAVLLQQRGTALGSAFGGGGEVYSTRRGFQKNLFWITIVLITAFVVLSVLNLIYQ